jgi:hypothetical protein
MARAVSDPSTTCTEDDIKRKEDAIMSLGETLAERRSIDHLRTMIERACVALAHSQL